MLGCLNMLGVHNYQLCTKDFDLNIKMWSVIAPKSLLGDCNLMFFCLSYEKFPSAIDFSSVES